VDQLPIDFGIAHLVTHMCFRPFGQPRRGLIASNVFSLDPTAVRPVFNREPANGALVEPVQPWVELAWRMSGG
jgi:hypothetical protein